MSEPEPKTPGTPLPNWLYRGYQTALVVIVLIYALILVILMQAGMFINISEAIRLIGSLFVIYLAPGTFLLVFAIILAMTGNRPGPVMAALSFPAAFWTIVAGYNVVLT